MPVADAQRLVGQWAFPRKGVVRTIPAHELPPDALYDGHNVMLHGGQLRGRPGLTIAPGNTATPFPTIGASMYFSPAGSPTILFANTQRLFSYTGAITTDLTNTLLTGTYAQLGRFALIEFGTPEVVYAVFTNGVDAPRAWTGSATFANLAGSPPLWTDITNAYDRIVGVVPPYKVSWGEQAQLDKWPVLNTRFLSETVDPIVAISGRGVSGVIVYKRKSIWVGVPQGGSSAFAFVFQPREQKDGPAGAQAKVTVDNTDYYMTLDGRIAAYDGFNHQWVGHGIWPIVQATINPTEANRTMAWFDPPTRTVYFAYPKLFDSTAIVGLAAVCLPAPEQGIEGHACFTGTLGREVYTATQAWFGGDPQEKALVFSNRGLGAEATLFEGATDLGTTISGYWQPGLAGTPGLTPMRMDLVEPFFQRGVGYGTVTVRPKVSNVLDLPGGTDATPYTVDLAQAPVYEHGASRGDARGRFFGLRFEYTAGATIRYSGALAYGRPA